MNVMISRWCGTSLRCPGLRYGIPLRPKAPVAPRGKGKFMTRAALCFFLGVDVGSVDAVRCVAENAADFWTKIMTRGRETQGERSMSDTILSNGKESTL